MSYAQLSEEGVNRPDLYSCPAASIPKFSGSDMILTLRLNQRKRRESFDDLSAGLGAVEALQKFLQHKAGRDDHIRTQECVFQVLHLRL